jgi:hypothetical protein
MAPPAQVRFCASKLLESPASIRNEIDLLAKVPMTYACARFDDAAFYAQRERRGLPLVISFEVPLADVVIDGKDFLYTVFQLWDREGKSHLARVRMSLASLFGTAILPWFDRASREKDTISRIGLCDLATHDLAVIEAHHGNEIGILGRYGTRFRSAFAVPATIDPAAVLAVDEVDGSFDSPAAVVNLSDMLKP